MSRWRKEVDLTASPLYQAKWEAEMLKEGWVKVEPCKAHRHCQNCNLPHIDSPERTK